MGWAVLIASGALETVWAVALAQSDSFKRFKASALFIAAMVLSMAGLAYAMTYISTGTAYAVWVGIGASGTVAWGAVTGAEQLTAARAGLLLLLICSVVGLKVVS